MADQTNDLLMRVLGNKGTPLAADSLTKFVVGTDQDILREGFEAGYFCDLIDFSFSAGVEPTMSKGLKEKKDQEALLTKMRDMNKAAEDKDKKPEPKWKKSREMEALEFVQQQRRRAEKRLKVETVDMQPVEYTRLMDSSSTLLMQSLCKSETLRRISVVKRKATGDQNSGLCYLRLDFTNVLLTRLELKDEQHVVHESGTFIYKNLSIRYRPQLASGNLGAEVAATWSMPRAQKPQPKT